MSFKYVIWLKRLRSKFDYVVSVILFPLYTIYLQTYVFIETLMVKVAQLINH